MIAVEKLKSSIIINNKGELLFPESEFGKRSEARNRLLVDLLVRTDFMEKAGTGIKRITDACTDNKNACKFNFSDAFWIEIFSNVTPQVQNLITVLDGNLTALEIREKLNLSDREYFRLSYLKPALEQGYIATEFPNPNHPKQRYYLTEKGKAIVGKT